MRDATVFIAGLPSAGKTTFLAALWHLVRSGDITTALAYAGLEGIDAGYLNRIQARWLEHQPMGRTRGAEEQLARLNLVSEVNDRLTLALPDFAGEGFRRMWGSRRVTAPIQSSAQSADGHLLLVNIDKIAYPISVDEYREALAATGTSPDLEIPFDLAKCPTAAILADIFCALEHAPISARPKRIALALTAWDTVADDGLTPRAMLAERLPLIDQMVRARTGDVEYRVFGISAQGSAYDDLDVTSIPELPSHRIQVVDNEEVHHDLTRVLSWLLG